MPAGQITFLMYPRSNIAALMEGCFSLQRISCRLGMPTILLVGCLWSLPARGQSDPAIARRPVTAADAIGMTRLARQDYLAGGPTGAPIAPLSPGGTHLV